MSDQRKKIKQIKALHRVREIRENQKKNLLAAVLKEKQVYVEQIQFLENLRQDVYDNIKKEQKETLNPNQMMKYQMFLRQIHIKNLVANTSVNEIEKEVQKRRTDLMLANQQKIAAEKLLNRQKEILKQEENYQEIKTLDEVGSNLRLYEEQKDNE